MGRRLRVHLEEIGEAMDAGMSENQRFLDTETGELVILPPDLRDEDVLDDDYVGDLPEWERELVPIARAVGGEGGRYTPVPGIEAGEMYDAMVGFAATVPDDRLRDQLDVALDGRGAFGRFRRLLAGDATEQERWFRARRALLVDRAREWLQTLDIEPVADAGPVERDLPCRER